MRRKVIIFGIVNCLIFVGIGILLFALQTMPNVKEHDAILQIVSWAFIGVGALYLVFAIFSTTCKAMAIINMIYAIIAEVATAGSGTLCLVGAVMALRYINEGRSAEYEKGIREEKRARKEAIRKAKEEQKKMLKEDPLYKPFLSFLRKRKVKCVFQSFFLTVLSFTFSLGAGVLYFVYVADPYQGGNSILGDLGGIALWLLPFAVYIAGAFLYLLVKGIQPAFSFESSQEIQTNYYSLHKGWSEYELRLDRTKKETKYKTNIFLTPKGFLFLLVAWFWVIPQAIAFLIALFIPSTSVGVVAKSRVDDIPDNMLVKSRKLSGFLAFFLGFVIIDPSFLDYLYYLHVTKKYKDRPRYK